MQTDLQFLQSLKEDELRGLIIMPLLEKLDYLEIRSTHGVLELGKDIVFARLDPLEGLRYCCAIVKRIPLTGSVATNRSIREVYFQTQQALTEPFISPFDGSKALIEKAYFITPFDIDPSCANSIKAELQQSHNQIHFIDGPTLLSYLKQHLPALLTSLPDPSMRYLVTLARRIAQIRSLDHFGYATQLTLADIYTGGDLSKVTAEEARFISFSKPDLPSERVPLMSAFENSRRLVILADVGAGKTTLLQRFALDLINAHIERGSAPSGHCTIPLFVSLYALDADTLLSYESFVRALQQYVGTREGFAEFDIDEVGRYTLLLDGFDELSAHHSAVAQHLVRLAQRFEGGVVVTSRPSRIPQVDASFATYRLNPFSEADIETFLMKWFPGNAAVREQMSARIRSDDILARFCRSPLMLTMYAILASRYSVDRLPTRRTDIYESITRMLLDEWDRSRGIKSDFSFDAKQYVLEQVAYRTHTERRKQFTSESFEEIASEFFAAQRLEVNSADMFREILFRSSLVRPGTGNAYEFIHLSFQEFLCAKYLARAGDQKVVDVLLYDEWWKNVGSFYFGLKRTLDGTRLTIRQDARGIGFKLVEYLTEADYTSEALRKRIYRIMSNELLRTVDLTQAELDVCSTFGDDVLQTVDSSIVGEFRPKDKSSDSGNIGWRVFNFVRLIFQTDRPALNRLLLTRPQYLDHLSEEELFNLLELVVPRLGSSNWVAYFGAVAELLEGRFRAAQKKVDEFGDRLVGLQQLLRKTEKVGGKTAGGVTKVGKHVRAMEKTLKHLRSKQA